MPAWLSAALMGATLATVAGAYLLGLAGGWVLGYLHRDLVEWGRLRLVRLLARAYRDLHRDITRLAVTGRWT